MQIKFWGVRGSIGVSGPDYTSYGGHTSCIELTADGERLILDAGSGIRLLGKVLVQAGVNEHHILLSHFHYDHLSGLGFFAPLYLKGHVLNLHGPGTKLAPFKQRLGKLFHSDHFPVDLRKVPARLNFFNHQAGRFSIDSFQIETLRLNHPGQTIGYIIKYYDKSIAYICDHEPISHANHGLNSEHYEKKLLLKLQGLDCLIHDGQYSDEDYPHFIGWGHSPWAYPLDLAVKANIPQLILTHFAPDYDDAFLEQAEKTYRGHRGPIKLILAREGMTCDIGPSCKK